MYRYIILALTVLVGSAFGGVIDISASERGWVCATGCLGGGGITNNGASPINNYLAGEHSGSQFRDWLEFAIPILTGGPLVSAQLNLFEPSTPVAPTDGHGDGTLSFAVYGLSAQPVVFTDVTTANPFGSVSTSSASDGTTVTITLNAAALAAIGADQAANIFIGGIDSGELSTEAFDFAATQTPGSSSVLSLTTASSVPEPSSLWLLVSAIVLVGLRRKNTRALS